MKNEIDSLPGHSIMGSTVNIKGFKRQHSCVFSLN